MIRSHPWVIPVLLLAIVLLFGSSKLPDLARNLGKSLKIVKKEVRDLRSEDDAAAPQAPTAPAQQAPAVPVVPTAPAGPGQPVVPVVPVVPETPAEPASPTSDEGETGDQSPKV